MMQPSQAQTTYNPINGNQNAMYSMPNNNNFAMMQPSQAQTAYNPIIMRPAQVKKSSESCHCLLI